jgi:hypothetical protein
MYPGQRGLTVREKHVEHRSRLADSKVTVFGTLPNQS